MAQNSNLLSALLSSLTDGFFLLSPAAWLLAIERLPRLVRTQFLCCSNRFLGTLGFHRTSVGVPGEIVE